MKSLKREAIEAPRDINKTHSNFIQNNVILSKLI